MDINSKRYEKEEFFHNTMYEKNVLRSKLIPYYQVADNVYNFYKKMVLNGIMNKTLLEYGCGIKSEAFDASSSGGIVTGIDISGSAINISKSIAKENKLDIQFIKMNAEKLEFENNKFDKICGSGIIHHLDVKIAALEIRRVLKIDGQAIFLEPLGYNPIINFYRFLTPSLRTEDEHPLKLRDIKIFKNLFNVRLTYFCLFSLLSVLFIKSRYFNIINNIINKLDSIILKLPLLNKLAWIVIIELTNNKATK